MRSHLHMPVVLLFATFNDTDKNYVTRKASYHQMFVKKEELSLQAVKQCKVKCPDELSKMVVIKDKIFELGHKLGQTIISINTKNKLFLIGCAMEKDNILISKIENHFGVQIVEDKMHLYRLRLVITLVTSAANNAREKVMKACQMSLIEATCNMEGH
ncbi:hypothetical protein AAG906_005632 [Vitis piasezkii]